MADFNYNLLMIYFMLFISGFIVLNFLMGGFVIQWWKVKKSRGKLMLIKVRNSIANYWRTASYDNGSVSYTGRSRKDNPNPNRLITVTDDELRQAVNRDWGINWIEVDDDKGCLFVRDDVSYKAVEGFNPEKMDELVQTALAKPSKQDGLFDTRTFQIIVLIGFVAVLGLSYWSIKNIGMVDDHLKLIYDLTVQLTNSTVVG